MTEDAKHLTVKEWAKEDRPREKMISIGKKNLTNAELLGILIGSGIQGTNAVELGRQMLSDSGNNLIKLSRIDFARLKSYRGIGEAKAITIMAALELGYRMLNEKGESEVKYINTSEDLFNHIADNIIELDHEEFWVVFLNNKHKILDTKRIAQGGMTQTTVDLRLIFKQALELGAAAIAVAHNHPSGLVQPSKEDKLLTDKISSSGKVLGIMLLDHIIVGVGTEAGSTTKKNWYSFAEHDLL